MGWLTLLVFSPLIGLLVLTVIPKVDTRQVKLIGILATFVPLLLSFMVYGQFHAGNTLAIAVDWIQFAEGTFKIDYELGIDGFTLLLVLLTTVVSSLSAIAASIQIKQAHKAYFIWFLLLEMGMLGVFTAENLILFFFFFEMTLVPMFFLVGRWGFVERENAAYSFLIYNGLGSAVLLIVFIAIFANTGTTNIEALKEIMENDSYLSEEFRYGCMLALLIAFGVKLPIVPLHTWMLRVHVHAPVAIVMIHAGILLKIGAYGLINFGIGIFGDQFVKIAPFIAVLGLINLLYGAFLAFVQTELKSVFAYSSVSHMGIVLLGVAAMNEAGIQGAIFQTLSHGLIASLLFFLVGIIYERTRTTKLDKLGGLAKTMPLTAGFLLTAALASLGLPGMSGFVSEFMAFLGLFEKMPWMGAIGTLGIIMTVVYLLRAVLGVTYGKTIPTVSIHRDLSRKEMFPAAVLLAFILMIGIYPNVITHTLKFAIDSIMLGIGG
ncbi:complex I subunit 4 family protein [Thalassobacillus pellis]|uniref:complex I subunit 4 family protein n=1 Tax=Thalassobacillus pellis TaxID=748008 RepID=UPI001960D3EE|nr:NADH-quinone oxidoreductase subunit M [Thalassobacillus pellis]MBM7551748.1 NADH-quinone oxidoreductase subunit M [Thalassobacillus pellis]